MIIIIVIIIIISVRLVDMPQNTLPVLVIDGKTTITQSYAIARYVAKELRKYSNCSLIQWPGIIIKQYLDTSRQNKVYFSPFR